MNFLNILVKENSVRLSNINNQKQQTTPIIDAVIIAINSQSNKDLQLKVIKLLNIKQATKTGNQTIIFLIYSKEEVCKMFL